MHSSTRSCQSRGPRCASQPSLRYTESGHEIRPSQSECCPGLFPLEPAERPSDEETRREVNSVLMSTAPTFQKNAGWRTELTEQSRRDKRWGEGSRALTGPRPTAGVPALREVWLHLTSASGGLGFFPSRHEEPRLTQQCESGRAHGRCTKL